MSAIIEKRNCTNLLKYGYKNAAQSPDVELKRLTNIEKYGVEHPNQVGEFFEKQLESANKYKEYTLPSGKIVKLQGYEKYAMDILIKSDRQEMPEIWYEHSGKKKRYFTDFYIPKDNLIIEVKSIILIKGILLRTFVRHYLRGNWVTILRYG
jgi:hypothetical protein